MNRHKFETTGRRAYDDICIVVASENHQKVVQVSAQVSANADGASGWGVVGSDQPAAE